MSWFVSSCPRSSVTVGHTLKVTQYGCSVLTDCSAGQVSCFKTSMAREQMRIYNQKTTWQQPADTCFYIGGITTSAEGTIPVASRGSRAIAIVCALWLVCGCAGTLGQAVPTARAMAQLVGCFPTPVLVPLSGSGCGLLSALARETVGAPGVSSALPCHVCYLDISIPSAVG